MTETEYDRLRELCGRWHHLAKDDESYGDGLHRCADDLKAVLDSFPEPRRFVGDPGDSCSTCGAEPNEPCRDGCAYAARTHRGWRDVPRTVLGERVLEEITEMRRDFPDDI